VQTTKQPLKLLLSGGYGFLGRHTQEQLKSHNIEYLAPTKSELNLLDDPDIILDYLLDNKVTHIIHLAAKVGGIGLNIDQPGKLTYVNLQMGLNLIEAARHAKIERFICIGTCCSYAANCSIPFQEEDFIQLNRYGPGMPEQSNSGYGLAKFILYKLLDDYKKQYGMDYVYLIPINLVGPGDNFMDNSSHVVPALLKKMHLAKIQNLDNIELWGTGTATRSFLDVRDCANGIVNAIDFKETHHTTVFNLGTDVEISIKDLADKIKNIIGFNGQIKFGGQYSDGQPRRRVSITRAKTYLNFQSNVSLEQSIKDSYEWWLQNDKQ